MSPCQLCLDLLPSLVVCDRVVLWLGIRLGSLKIRRSNLPRCLWEIITRFLLTTVLLVVT